MRLIGQITSAWRARKLRWFEGRNHRRLEMGPGNRFDVPVRSWGQGTLLIGADNMFGYLPAPKMGNGEILLQPRSRDAQIVIGNHNAFSNNVSFISLEKITLGDHCLIGDQVMILDCDHHEIDSKKRHHGTGPVLPVTIGNNVWLGSRVMVLKGVTIGNNTVIAAMSVVTRSIPENCLAAGVPAKVIKQIG